ncbi:ydjO [Escherichia coli]|nr:ydjO [Escherichia coli]
MMSLWDALRMNMMISYQELVRTFPNMMSFNREICICCEHKVG